MMDRNKWDSLTATHLLEAVFCALRDKYDTVPMTSPSALFKTAVSTKDNLVAVLHSHSIGPSRLSIPLYNFDGNLQSTLTAALLHDDNNDTVHIQKLVFCSPHYICALLNSNTIIVWNIVRGVVVHTLKLDQGAFDIACTSNSDHALFLITRKKNKLYIHEYSLETGKVTRKIKCGINHEEKSRVACAVCEEYVAIRQGQLVRVLSLENGSKVAKLKLPVGDKDDHNLMMSMKDERLAIVTPTGILLYNVVNSPDKPVAEIFLDQPISMMQMEKSTISVTTESLSTSLYEWPSSSANQETSSSLKPMTSISFQDGVDAGTVSFSSSQEEIVAVLHSSSKGIHVQQVSCKINNIDGMVIGFPSEQVDDDSTKTKATKRSHPSTTTTLGPGQAGGEALQASDRSTKRPKPTQEDDEEEDIAIAERLRLLAREMERNEDEDDDEEQQHSTQNSSFNTRKATTESLSHLLNQALSSGDDTMLELSLGVRDKRIIATSLQELDSDLASLLLTKLTFRLSHKPNRASDLSIWIALVLQSGKVRQPEQLRPLRNLLQERVESFPHLLQLEGRLSILATMK